MYRFYLANADFTQKKLTITDSDESHHIQNVLKLKQGSKIQIFNNQNQEASVIINSLSDYTIHVSVESVKEVAPSKAKIILACAPPKKDKFEWIIEKCTELGVDEIIPLKTKRGQVIYSSEKMAAKLARFEKVVISASKQSKRIQMPKVHPMTELFKVLKSLDPAGIHVFPSLNGHATHIKDVLLKATQDQSVTIFIGPEGDFTPEEVHMAQEAGCAPVSLGSTVLRVETAAMAAVSLARFLLKD